MTIVTITAKLRQGVDPHEFGDSYVSLIRATGDDVGDVEEVSYDVTNRSYRCTVLVEMPPDDGRATRPEDLVTHLGYLPGVTVLDVVDEDLIPEEKRTT
jgi:hypothetical protein